MSFLAPSPLEKAREEGLSTHCCSQAGLSAQNREPDAEIMARETGAGGEPDNAADVTQFEETEEQECAEDSEPPALRPSKRKRRVHTQPEGEGSRTNLKKVRHTIL